MYKYFYHICTKAKNKKYQVYKLIQNNNDIIMKEVLYFSDKQLKSLMKILSTEEYITYEKEFLNFNDLKTFTKNNKKENNYIYNKLLEGNLSYP